MKSIPKKQVDRWTGMCDTSGPPKKRALRGSPVRDALRRLEIRDTVTIKSDLSFRGVRRVNNSIYRYQVDSGRKFTYKQDHHAGTIIITRIQ